MTYLLGVKPNIGGVDIGRGELTARPLGAASPAVVQIRRFGFSSGILALMHQAPLTPAVCVDTLGVSHPPFPAHAVLFPRTIEQIGYPTKSQTNGRASM